ncbi:hypothetical protein F2Q69_00027086 [Brassica cretica]|uniref:Ubiquitin-like protease family profile domain-containing protein n=1 Tax=Brassica cretica TaxID=69181 RepID=A0A8S9RZ90_BRACR|nr:hypothetical protein F2Q69_00027086 [Brassica cretica]
MFKVPQLKDEDISTDKMFPKKAVRDRMVESDDESTVDGYPMLNTQNTQPQKSSSVKIIQPTASIAENFIQRKVGQTLKVMGVDQPKIGREKSTRVKKLGSALQTPFRGILPNLGNNKQDNQLNIMRGLGYDPFAPVDMQKVKILDDWLQLDEEYPIGSQNNGVEFFKILRTHQDWLNEEHINSAMNLLRLRFMKNPKTFRSDRIAFTDTYFTVVWTRSYNEFLSAQDLPIFPNGAHDYCSGKLPAFAGTGKKWMIDVDYIYSVLFVNNNHWVAIYISIPNRCIEVFDCGLKGSTNEQIVKAVKPFAHMLPHLLRASGPPSERPKMSVEQYKIRRPRQGIPQC